MTEYFFFLTKMVWFGKQMRDSQPVVELEGRREVR